jgi:hypothetical protein
MPSRIKVPIQSGSFLGADTLVPILGARYSFEEVYNCCFSYLRFRNQHKWVNVDRTEVSRLCIM